MQYLFSALQFALLMRCLQLQAWRKLPMFCGYLAASAVITALPRHVNDPGWWHSTWLVCSVVLLIGRALMLGEAFWRVTASLRGLERRWLLLSLAAGSTTVLVLLFVMPEQSTFHGWVSIRQYMQIAMFLWALFTVVYLWIADSAGNSHLAILAAFLTVQAVAGALDPRTGMLPIDWSDASLNSLERLRRMQEAWDRWRTVDMAYYSGACLCCVAWLVHARSQRRRHVPISASSLA